MRITADHGTALNDAFRRRPVYQKPDAAQSAGTSLTVPPLSAASPPHVGVSPRPQAVLLAQLIAKAQDMPASRERRRIEPAEGTNAYRVAAGLGRAGEGKNLRLI